MRRILVATAEMAALIGPLVTGVQISSRLRAQTTFNELPKFEVASVKSCQQPPQIPGAVYPPRGASSPGNLRTSCYPLLDPNGMGLIRSAYVTLADGRLDIEGGPPWIRSAFYEINGRAEGSPSVGLMMGPMMRTLLEDRFRLKIHRETREGHVYYLTVARGGIKAPRFIEGSCTPVTSPRTPLKEGEAYCNSQISGRSPASVEVQGATLDDFAKLLLAVLEYPVINKTGIDGRFDLRVKFSREGTRFGGLSPAQAADGRSSDSDQTAAPSIFAAFQEQLGLKLEAGKGPVERLVIDHIERPAEN